MDELAWVYLTVALMAGTLLYRAARRSFDPFEPIWLYFVGYAQVYVIQALSYHEWAVNARGAELVAGANCRATWALAWFLGVYFVCPGRVLAKGLPGPPRAWSRTTVYVLSPLLLAWGLACARGSMWLAGDSAAGSAEASLALSFPLVMLVGGVLLIVTGRQPSRPMPALAALGVGTVALYMVLWMFIGRRAHALMAVLIGVCSFYLPRLRRPSPPILLATAVSGALAVGIAIGWRYFVHHNPDQKSGAGFLQFVATFDPGTILESLNLKEGEGAPNPKATKETEEYGGFLLMMDTVPGKSDYDYGMNYLRCFSTFIPRIVWEDKPLFGREQWKAAWVAGSEQKRTMEFYGPAIGILGATQLNGGAGGTMIVLGAIAVMLRSAYEYFRRYADVPWVQVFWPLFYYNAWFMTVNDDPANWFYYNYGFTTMPPLIVLWFANKLQGGAAA